MAEAAAAADKSKKPNRGSLGSLGGGGLLSNLKNVDEELKERVSSQQAKRKQEGPSNSDPEARGDKNRASFAPEQPKLTTVFSEEEKKQTEKRRTLQQVPSLDLAGVGAQPVGRLALVMSEIDKEVEQKAGQSKVTGPSDKKWESFGVAEANDKEQMIKIDKKLKQKQQQKIKETVDKQMHELIVAKRGWAYYEKHQPDYTAFQNEIRKIIMTLVGPTVTENTKNGVKIDQVKSDQDDLSKRLEEVEIVYKRVAKNASAQQDALSELETRSNALKITENRLRDQVNECQMIKSQLADKFKLLRDDRTTVLMRLDHVDNEIDQYRSEIRQIHDQISESVLEKVREANARTLTNETMFNSIQTKVTDMINRFESLVEMDFREQAILVGKLQENYIEHRKAINNLDKAIVTRFDWLDKNRVYDHQINLLMSKNNQLEYDFSGMNKYLAGVHKTEVQTQIDKTILAVLGERKKYMKLLKGHSDDFYTQFNMVTSRPRLAQSIKIERAEIVVKSDADSDDSVSRLQRQMTFIQGFDGDAAPGGNINNVHVMQILKKHEDMKLEKVREKYLKRIPLRRMSCYKENNIREFIQKKNSKLRQLTNKQQQQLNQLSVYKHLAISNDRRLSSSLSNSSQLRGNKSMISGSGFSINKTKPAHHNTIDQQSSASKQLKTKTKFAIKKGSQQSQSASLKKIELKKVDSPKKLDLKLVMGDQKEIKKLFDKLKNRHKLEIAQQLVSELEKQNKSNSKIKLLQVKQNTIQGAIDAQKENRDYQMIRIELAAITQVLTMSEARDDNGHMIELKELRKGRQEIVKRIIDLEFQHRGESSSERSSKASRHADVLMAPPVIAIEAQASDRSHRRSKTMGPSQKTQIQDESEESKSSSYSLDASMMETDLPHQIRTSLKDLKSVHGSDKSPLKSNASSESLARSSRRPVKLALQHVSRQKSTSEKDSSKHLSLLEDTDSISVSHKEPFTAKANHNQVIARRKGLTETDRVVGKKRRPKTAGKTTIVLKQSDTAPQDTAPQYGEESYDFPTDTVGETHTNKGRSDYINEQDLGLLPDKGDVPEAEGILEKMKDQMDELERKLQDRTTELREVQKFMKRFELGMINEMTKRFEEVYNVIYYDKINMKEHLQSRMDIIGNRFVEYRKKMASAKEEGSQDLVAIKRRIKLFGRRVDIRMDEVNSDHDKLGGKYGYLLSCNDYIAKIAAVVIKIIELNSSLIRADERDKKSICLMGAKGPQTVQEKNQETHLKRLQRQVDDIEQSDFDYQKSNQVTVQAQNQRQHSMRPKSGVSYLSNQSKHTVLSQHTSKKSKFAGRDDDQPVIQIDKRCQTCSDSKGQLLHLFKIACLSYFPGHVEYRGKKYGKSALLQQQDEFVAELKRCLELAAGSPSDKATAAAAAAADVPERPARIRSKERTEELGSSAEEDIETQINTDTKLALASSDGLLSKHPMGGGAASSQLRSPKSTERQGATPEPSSGQRGGADDQIDSNRREKELNSAQPQAHSNIKNIQKPILSVKSKPVQSPTHTDKHSEFTQHAMALQESKSNKMMDQSINVAKLSGLSHLKENTGSESTGNLKGQHNRNLKRGRVSFDNGKMPLSPITQDSGSIYAQHQQKQSFKVNPTQTSFRFNCTHELLAFNQEQIQQIVSNPINEQKQKGVKVDEKLLQIQKLKEKAMMIQMTREVNKPNAFIGPKSKQYSPLFNRSGRVMTPTGDDIFPTREQVEYARSIARRKQQKETQIMIETRERFTKRFQFEKLSHQLLEGTPTETQFSGSAHNQLARYDSKTIFRQTHRQPTETRIPKTYANLMRNDSYTLPKLTRNQSAQYNTHAFASEEVFADVIEKRQKKRNQRPISSMNENKSFWRATKKNDGKSMIIVNRQRLREIDWSKPRESAGTEQINQMLGGTNTMSNVNLSQQ